MLYDTRVGFLALLLSGVFAGMALAGGPTSAWMAAGCFAAASIVNFVIDWLLGRDTSPRSRD